MKRKQPVSLYWWRWQPPHRLNFGDEITAPLIERITGRKSVWASPETCALVGAGSVLGKVIRLRGDKPLPQFWGTGFITPQADDDPEWDIPALGVRGRLSRERLTPRSAARAEIGDPGLLADMLLKRAPRKKYALGIVPHYKDVEAPAFLELEALGAQVHRIDVTLTPEEVTRQIASCEAVISSSLHGMIVADSVGVPNLHLPGGASHAGGSFKFRDYFSSFEDRPYRRFRPQDVEGLSLDTVLERLHERYEKPHGISGLKRGLVRSLKHATL